MPFRQRVKRAFGRSGSPSDSLSLQKTTSSARKDVYQPGEAIPPPKYRGRLDPNHQAKLEKFSFSFGDWRRKSSVSDYSPTASRRPSRNNSVNTSHKPSYIKGNSYFGQVDETADDPSDVANVGGTRNHSVDAQTQSDSTVTKDSPAHSEYADTSSDRTDGPISEAELTTALSKLQTGVPEKQEL